MQNCGAKRFFMISTLRRLAGIDTAITQASNASINFNATLPITVEVLKKLDSSRYRLKLGRKELTTKSHKALCEGEMYWGDFSQGQGGILTLSQLFKQPRLFQDKDSFLETTLDDILGSNAFSLLIFKEVLLEALLNKECQKNHFKTFSYMLLALTKGVVHLPLRYENRRYLLQFIPQDESCTFYAAFENLGPLYGKITQDSLQLIGVYEKSLYFLDKELPKLGMIATLGLQKEIHPLFDADELSLNLKG